MKDRIDLLALQAINHKGELDRHKFAELIIFECVKLAVFKGHTDLGRDIRDHFGVEE